MFCLYFPLHSTALSVIECEVNSKRFFTVCYSVASIVFSILGPNIVLQGVILIILDVWSSVTVRDEIS